MSTCRYLAEMYLICIKDAIFKEMGRWKALLLALKVDWGWLSNSGHSHGDNPVHMPTPGSHTALGLTHTEATQTCTIHACGGHGFLGDTQDVLDPSCAWECHGVSGKRSMPSPKALATSSDPPGIWVSKKIGSRDTGGPKRNIRSLVLSLQKKQLGGNTGFKDALGIVSSKTWSMFLQCPRPW